MNQQVQPLPSHNSALSWPLNLDGYDRNPSLTETERNEFARIFRPSGHPTAIYRRNVALSRLLQPIVDAIAYVHADKTTLTDTIRFVSLEMHQRGKAFWGWTIEEWCECLCQSDTAFSLRFERRCMKGAKGRQGLAVLVYLLCPSLPIDPLIHLMKLNAFSQKIIRKEVLDEAVRRLQKILQSWGYLQKDHVRLTACVGYLLLRNRSPNLDDLTIELLETVAQNCPNRSVQDKLFQVSKVLLALGIINRPLSYVFGRGKGTTRPVENDNDGSISDAWFSWCQRWRKHTTLQNANAVYYPLLKVGRWLKVMHSDITSPAQWTYELAAEFVAAVNEMNVGEWIDTRQRRMAVERFGKPMRANSKEKLFKAMRKFLYDCREWEWVQLQINPHRALSTPRSIRNLLAPNPRIIDKEFWAKILWAAMNLEAEDLPLAGNDMPVYPLEMVRAIAAVWCFAALRSDEIWRLRIGCMRWQHEDVMIPETGELLPKDATCFLDVPVNKTSRAYTKAVHTIVGKRVNEWERIRPKEQPRGLDKKTSESVQFLFSFRGKRISKAYINEALIPLLCKKVGIPEQDSRGQITSHRARATIASMLYNAKEPLTIFELKEYLGHKHLSSTQSYVSVDPTKLASKVAKTGYLEQNMATVEVLLDQDAVMSGAAARGEAWKYYDLGHGYCTNAFWAECKHRMACARCPFYRPKSSMMEHLVEGKANLVRMLEFVALTEDERLLVTEGIELHQTLLEKLVDEPTPAGPTPRQLEEQRQQTETIIPLPTVQRVKQKK